MISRKIPPPHMKPTVALPNWSAMNHEKEMTRKRRKKSAMKLINETRINRLSILEMLLMDVSLIS